MSRLTRDGTAEPVSRDQILRHARGQGNIHFPCLADHEQDWQPYRVDPYSAICDDHTYIHTQQAESGAYLRDSSLPSSAVASIYLFITAIRHRVSPELIGSRNCVPMAFTTESPQAHGQ